jgi:predicted nucleic acid-binding protein
MRLIPAHFLPPVRRPNRAVAAPLILQGWLAERPLWLEVIPVDLIDNAALQPLSAGEKAAIALAMSMHADLILIDERQGTSVAIAKGFTVTGTLGIFRLAAQRGLIDLADTISRLKRTNFRYRQEMLDDLLAEFPQGA